MVNGHRKLAVLLLVLYIAAGLGYSQVLNYDLTDLSLTGEYKKLSLSCRQTVKGHITIKSPSEGAKTLVSLDYTTALGENSRSLSVTDDSFAFNIIGAPSTDAVWKLRAYYYNSRNQISEASTDLSGIGCSQTIERDLVL